MLQSKLCVIKTKIILTYIQFAHGVSFSFIALEFVLFVNVAKYTTWLRSCFGGQEICKKNEDKNIVVTLYSKRETCAQQL